MPRKRFWTVILIPRQKKSGLSRCSHTTFLVLSDCCWRRQVVTCTFWSGVRNRPFSSVCAPFVAFIDTGSTIRELSLNSGRILFVFLHFISRHVCVMEKNWPGTVALLSSQLAMSILNPKPVGRGRVCLRKT